MINSRLDYSNVSFTEKEFSHLIQDIKDSGNQLKEVVFTKALLTEDQIQRQRSLVFLRKRTIQTSAIRLNHELKDICLQVL